MILTVFQMKNIQIFTQTQERIPFPQELLNSGESIPESTLLRPRNIPKQIKEKELTRKKISDFPKHFHSLHKDSNYHSLSSKLMIHSDGLFMQVGQLNIIL